jgi:hypothetical protein
LLLCRRCGALALDVLQQGLVVRQAQAAQCHGPLGRAMGVVEPALFEAHLGQVVPGIGEIA